MSRYVVTGTRPYRGHNPGTLFEATLTRAEEMRALGRGNLVVISRQRASIDPAKIRRP